MSEPLSWPLRLRLSGVLQRARRQYFVYATREPGTVGPIKIGRSRNPERRVQEFARGRPMELLVMSVGGNASCW